MNNVDDIYPMPKLEPGPSNKVRISGDFKSWTRVTKQGEKPMNNLKKVRAEHGLTQAQLAKLSGVSRATIVSSECGFIAAETAIKIASALHTNVFELMGTDVFAIVPTTRAEKDYIIDNLLK